MDLQQSEPNVYTVGFYSPDGTFQGDSDHGYREQAAERCHYLNGGNQSEVDYGENYKAFRKMIGERSEKNE